MIRLLFDENFDQRISLGLRRRVPALDHVTVQKAGLRRTKDPDLLEWSAREDWVLVTHDVNTVPRYAKERLKAGFPMRGVIVVPEDLAIARAIEELEIVVSAASPSDLEGTIIYLPLR